MDLTLINTPDQELTWQQHIRKRPGMYLGQVNHKGFINNLKKIINQFLEVSHADMVDILFKDEIEGEITFSNISSPIREDIAVLNKDDYHKTLDLPILNSVSAEMIVTFYLATERSQHFQKAQSVALYSNTLINCSQLRIGYVLDKEIWGHEFKWNSNYLSLELRDLYYLHPNVKFIIFETQGEYTNTNTYQYSEGLSEQLEIEILNAHGTSHFKHRVLFKTENFDIEVAFAFRQYSIDPTYPKTYVNGECTRENGTHFTGVLKGINHCIKKYLQAHNLDKREKISNIDFKKRLVCIIHIKLEEAVFAGSIKSKLANTEIIKPIANHISEVFYESLSKDVESTNQIFDKFN